MGVGAFIARGIGRRQGDDSQQGGDRERFGHDFLLKYFDPQCLNAGDARNGDKEA
jgi:hypothetical protein